MSFQQGAFQTDAFQVGLGEPPAADPTRPIIFANGQSPAHIVALGFAIGGALIFGHGEFAPAQPIPQPAQYETQSRTHHLSGRATIFGIEPGLIPVAAQDPPNRPTLVARQQDNPWQIQPQVFKQQPAPSVTPVLRPIFQAQRQADPSIIQPLVFRQQLATDFLPSVELFDQPQFVPPTIQPTVFKGIFPGVTPDNPPNRPVIYARQQDSTYQIAPIVFRTLIFEATPLKGIISAAPQFDPRQIAPQLFEQAPAEAVAAAPIRQLSVAGQTVPNPAPVVFKTLINFEAPPNRPTLFAKEQDDPTQIQPVVVPFFFDQNREAPPNRPLYAFPQANPDQYAQPAELFPIAEIPSVTPTPADSSTATPGRVLRTRLGPQWKGETEEERLKRWEREGLIPRHVETATPVQRQAEQGVQRAIFEVHKARLEAQQAKVGAEMALRLATAARYEAIAKQYQAEIDEAQRELSDQIREDTMRELVAVLDGLRLEAAVQAEQIRKRIEEEDVMFVASFLANL